MNDDIAARLAGIEHRLETQLAIQAAMTPILIALMTTHPDVRRLQLQLTTLVEVFDATSPWSMLTADQREKARAYVEWLQTQRPARTAEEQPGTHLPGSQSPPPPSAQR